MPYPHFFMQAQKAFGNYIHSKSSCSVDYQLFNSCGVSTGMFGSLQPIAALSGMSAFVLAYNLEGIHYQHDEFRTCQELNTSTTILNFTYTFTSGGTTQIDTFALYEFDLVIMDKILSAEEKYITTSNIGIYPDAR